MRPSGSMCSRTDRRRLARLADPRSPPTRATSGRLPARFMRNETIPLCGSDQALGEDALCGEVPQVPHEWKVCWESRDEYQMSIAACVSRYSPYLHYIILAD